jgi:hypothetical protein
MNSGLCHARGGESGTSGNEREEYFFHAIIVSFGWSFHPIGRRAFLQDVLLLKQVGWHLKN